jgi:hypothetical protein
MAPITSSEMSSLLMAETPVCYAIYREKRGNSVSSVKPFIVPLSLISGEAARQQAGPVEKPRLAIGPRS